MTETQNEVTCLICGQSFRALSSHLRVHNISTYEYAKRFVGASTISYESSLSQSASQTERMSEIQLYTVLEKYFPGEWKYVGNYQVNVKRRFPDFIRINNEKQVIEMFGIHWHDPTYFPNRLTEEELIEHYKINGYTCLVFWEYDVWCHEDEIVERVKNLT